MATATVQDLWYNRQSEPTKRHGKGRRWCVRYRCPETGRHLSPTFERKAEAQAFRARISGQMASGDYVAPSRGAQPFSDIAHLWWRRHQQTYADSGPPKSTLDAQILPRLGSLRLDSIETTTIDGMVADMIDEGYADWTCSRTFTMTNQILEYAKDNNYIRQNPCDKATRPKQRRRCIIRPLSPKEVDKLAMECGVYGGFIYFLAYTGLRPSEAINAKWSHLNLERRSLVVPKSKTETDRTVGLTRKVIESLPEKGDALNSDYIFRSPEGERIYLNNWRKRRFIPAKQRAGLKDVRLYDLRHTCAAWLIDCGLEARKLMAWMGHKTIRVTYETYGHLMREDPSDVTDLLDAYDPAD